MVEGTAAQTNTVAYIVQIVIGALIVLYWVEGKVSKTIDFEMMCETW